MPTTGNDTLTGTTGNDTIDALAGDDSVNGLGGRDSLLGNMGSDTLNGEGGNDTLDGGDGNDIANGGADDDLLLGRAGSDTLNGDAGDDTLDGGGGEPDTLIGGNGTDMVTWVSQSTSVSLNLTVGAYSSNTGDTFGSDIERFTLSSLNDLLSGGVGNDWVDGGQGDDFLDGGAGNDTLIGGQNNDTLQGGPGSDRLEGQLGSDRLSDVGSAYDQFVFANAPSGTDTITNFDTLAGDVLVFAAGVSVVSVVSAQDFDGDLMADDMAIVTNQGTIVILNQTADAVQVVDGARAGDTLTGTGGRDLLVGNMVANTLNGGAGDDTLMGGWGDDPGSRTLIGGPGQDILNGTELTRVFASYTDAGTTQVVVNLETQIANSSVTGFDRMFSIEDVQMGSGSDIVLGSAAANTLLGGNGDDWLSGGLGNDFISGSGGVDQLIGGDGDDTLSGGSGVDFFYGGGGLDEASFFDIAGGCVANLATGFVNHAGVVDWVAQDVERFQFGSGADIVVGWTQNLFVDLGGGADWFADYNVAGTNDSISGNSGADTLQGLAGADTLIGGSDNDALYGGDGADRLDGGFGVDVMLGGAGADRFMYFSTSESTNLAPDIIGDHETGVDLIDLSGINPSGAFTIVGAFTNTAMELVLTNAGAYWTVNADTDGDALADMVVVVVASAGLSGVDFVL